MKLFDNIKAAFSATDKNSMNLPLGKQFLKHGNRKPLVQNWSQVIMTDRDLYTGYSYASIINRANSVNMLAEYYLKTKANTTITEQAKNKDEVVTHPYINLINESPTFTNDQFWTVISTYLDLEGIYYLMAIRAVDRNDDGELVRIGDIQEFKLLNPYNIKKVINEKTGEVGGYVEYKNGLTREIPIEMIIEMRELNPFDWNENYSPTDAGKDSQYTLKQAGDYTRHAIQKSVNAPGIVSVGDEELALDPQRFENFKSRIMGHEPGEPIFGTGKGAISFDDMQIDLNKSALDKVSEMNRDSLMAVMGTSKTMLGIEQSGTTRETSKVQRDLFTELHIMPRTQTIIGALNQDYKKYYSKQYESTGYYIYIDNPLKTDREAELADIDIRKGELEIYQSLVDKGYDKEVSAKYAEGDITIEELGEPKEMPSEAQAQSKKKDSHTCGKDCDHLIVNGLQDEQQGLLTQQQGALQSAVTNIESQVASTIIKRIQKAKNAFEEESDIITQTERKAFEKDLEVAIAAFLLVLIPLFGRNTMNKRLAEFQKDGIFTVNGDVKTYIKHISSKVSASHIDTIVNDIYSEVRQLALTGATQEELINGITKKYSEVITTTRAKTIARTETNRAFTMSQYEADKQFIKQNKLEGRAYKVFQTRSNNPCAFCLELQAQGPIPFDKPFASIGDELVVETGSGDNLKVSKMAVTFEDIQAGNVHPNCSCIYTLVIT